MVEAVRVFLLCVAGLLLFRLWRWLWRTNEDWRLRVVVTTGFVLRLLLGQILFWVSFAELPLARSLQSGNGLWFFAQDAQIYTTIAYEAASDGLAGIAAVPRSSPSASYIQVLAVFSLVFGHPVAVSLLLNLFCFLGSCAIITRWSAGTPAARSAAVLVAVSVVSLAPGGMLWALQPLKDTFFQLAMVSFAGSAYLWQSGWRAPDRGRVCAAAAAAMIVTLMLISGVRWYLGLILLAGSVVFFVLVALAARHRHLSAFAGGLLVLILMSRGFVFAAEPYLSPSLLQMLNGRPAALARAPKHMSQRVEDFRGGFVRAGGGSLIRPGPRLANGNTKKAETSQAVGVSEKIAQSTQGAASPKRRHAARAVESPGPDGGSDAPPVAQADVSSTIRETGVTSDPAVAQLAEAAGSAPAPQPPGAEHSSVAKVAPAPPDSNPTPVNSAPHTERSVEHGRPEPPPSGLRKVAPELDQPPKTVPAVAPVISTRATPRKRSTRQTVKGRSPSPSPPAQAAQPSAVEAPKTNPQPTPAPPGLSQVAENKNNEEDLVRRSQLRVAKLVTGAAAVTLPPSLSIRMGLVDVRSQSKLWWYVELDTLFFDALLLFVAGAVILNFRNGSYRNGMFWLLLAVSAMVGLALAYTVTNFGTLFRLRQMFATLAALIPLALMTAPRPDGEQPDLPPVVPREES